MGLTGYVTSFTSTCDRTDRRLIPASASVPKSPAVLKNAREGSLAVKGAILFNLLPLSLRNSNHGDVDMFKNHLDIFLADIPDQPTVAGLVRGAQTNSLLHQIPNYLNSQI